MALEQGGPSIEELEELVAGDPDDSLSRFMLGQALAKMGRWEEAIAQFRETLRLKPDYSAAFAELGKAEMKAGQMGAAEETFRQGIEVARERGDLHTAKVMEVFLNRLAKERKGGEG